MSTPLSEPAVPATPLRPDSEEPEQWYRSLYTHSLDGILLTSPDGAILAANPAMCSLLGYDEHELRTLGRDGVVDLTDPRLRAAIEQRRTTGGFVGELTLLAKDGRHIPVEISSRVYRDASGEERTSMFVRDITERLRANELLRWSEERFRVALKSSPIIVYSADAELRYTWMHNPHSRFRVEDVLGKRDEELVPEERVADLIAFKREIIATGKGGRRELRIVVDEEERYYDITAEPTHAPDGRVTGLTVAATDITERWHRDQERAQLLEIATRAREDAERDGERVALLAAVTEALTEMLEYEQSLGAVARLLAARLGTFCLVDVVEEDGGVRRIEAVHSDPAGQQRVDFLREVSLAAHQPHISRRALETGEADLVAHATDDDLRAVAQNDRHLAVLRELNIGSCLRLPLIARARTLGAITVVRDRTREPFGPADLALGREIARRAALAIDNAHLFRQARRAIELRDTILGIVSHDLRSPLTVISMTLAPFEYSEPDPANLAGLVSVTRQSIDSMERMIRDLLDVASIEAGKLSIERGPEDLSALLSRARAMFSPQLSYEGITLKTEIPESLPHADVDGERILQVVGNLLSNAGKFVARGGHVTLSARASGEELVVAVRDDGPGIPPEVVPHIFDRFWHSRRTARARGTGLGLSIAKAIIDAHGGRIWVDTVEGQGSTFSFSVPVFHSSVRRAAAAELREPHL